MVAGGHFHEHGARIIQPPPNRYFDSVNMRSLTIVRQIGAAEVGQVSTGHPSAAPPDLRQVVEAAIAVPTLATAEGRDAVLMLIRPELASAVARSPVPRLDIINIVHTCGRYQGGLREFLSAVRFLDGGSSALTRLAAAIAATPLDLRLNS